MLDLSMRIQIPSFISNHSMQPKHKAFSAINNAGSLDEIERTERPYDQQYNQKYYEEFRKLYHTSFLLSLKLTHLNEAKEEIWAKINKLEKRTDEFHDDIRGEQPERKKRLRRAAEEIERKFVCEMQRCGKCYGSQGSLQQHIKLKHPEIYEPRPHQRGQESHRAFQQPSQN